VSDRIGQMKFTDLDWTVRCFRYCV